MASDKKGYKTNSKNNNEKLNFLSNYWTEQDQSWYKNCNASLYEKLPPTAATSYFIF